MVVADILKAEPKYFFWLGMLEEEIQTFSREVCIEPVLVVC